MSSRNYKSVLVPKPDLEILLGLVDLPIQALLDRTHEKHHAALLVERLSRKVTGFGQRDCYVQFTADYNAVGRDLRNIKIPVIKSIRAATGLGLKEAKDLSELPQPIMVPMPGMDEAQAFRKDLESLGASASIVRIRRSV